MTVTSDWRDRARALRGEYWQCQHCQALGAVRRLVCAACGTRSASLPAPLPATLEAVAWSHGHIGIEILDQSERTRTFMLLRLPGGKSLPLALAETDASHAPELIGASLDLVLRRVRDAGDKEPIVYGRKVAASAALRKRVLENRNSSEQGKPDA